jgi:hypothetical protein
LVASVCEVKVRVGKYSEKSRYVITATPMAKHVMLQCKGMKWRLPHDNNIAWQQTMEFIFRLIRSSAEQHCSKHKHSIFDTDAERMRRLQSCMSLSVTVGSDAACSFQCEGWESLRKEFNRCLMGMQYMTAAV